MSHDNEKKPAQGNPPPLGADSVSWPVINSQLQLQKAAETLQSGGRVYPDQGNKIGEILKSLGVIDDKIIDAVEKRHHTKNAKDKPTGALLVYMGIIEAEVLTRALCIQSGVLMVEVQSIGVPYEILKLVTNDNAREKQAIPVGAYKGTLYLAVADPFNFSEQHFFSFSTGLKIKPVFAPHNQITTCLDTKWAEGRSEIWAG